MFTKWLTVTNDDHIKKSAKTNETKAQWFDAILMTHKRGMTNQLVCIKPSCRILYHCCKHFKMSNMDNSKYQIIYNYVCTVEGNIPLNHRNRRKDQSGVCGIKKRR